MRKPLFYGAVFGIIRDETWKILMIKRKNTGFKDGYYGLPSGHIELLESPTDAVKRELKEEVGIDVTKENLRIIHTSYSISENEFDEEIRPYFHFYFEVIAYTWTLANMEEDKSEGIYWIDPKTESKIQFHEIFEYIENGASYSEIDYRGE